MLSDVEELPSVQLGDYVLRFELEDLTPFGKEVAKNELRETPEIRAAAIEELRTLLKGKKQATCRPFGIALPLGIKMRETERDE